VTRDGELVIDDPEIRRRLIRATESYTAAYREGCTPPDSVTWDDRGNNRAFLAQTVVMTANNTLSIPNALKVERPDDYYKHVATIEWPLGPLGQTFPIEGAMFQSVVFKDGGHVATAKEFVRFLVADGWLMHYLDFSGEKMLPSIPALLDQPFWLDPGDPHRRRAAAQVLRQPHSYLWWGILKDQERLFSKAEPPVFEAAVHRIVVDGLTPEQAADEAIARLKQILSE
jgi:multiple sugar transport system substrate-binding protein